MKTLHDFIKFLKLKKPINLRIITKKNRFCDAEYEPEFWENTGRLKAHRITIFLKDNSRSFETLLAHELIHAWQEENKKTEIHGEHFKKYARRMEQEFQLTEIYIPGVDE